MSGFLYTRHKEQGTYAYELPALPYEFAALEPYIDARTMEIHHGKHHKTYIDNANNALKDHDDLAAHSVEDLIKNLAAAPDAIRGVLRNNAGGHANTACSGRSWPPMLVAPRRAT